jgi:hypothetical protein
MQYERHRVESPNQAVSIVLQYHAYVHGLQAQVAGSTSLSVELHRLHAGSAPPRQSDMRAGMKQVSPLGQLPLLQRAVCVMQSCSHAVMQSCSHAVMQSAWRTSQALGGLLPASLSAEPSCHAMLQPDACCMSAMLCCMLRLPLRRRACRCIHESNAGRQAGRQAGRRGGMKVLLHVGRQVGKEARNPSCSCRRDEGGRGGTRGDEGGPAY